MQWTAEPGIELTTGAAVVVRAYIESYYLAFLTADKKYLYPGFDESVDRDHGESSETRALWPQSRSPVTWIGTARHHLLRIVEAGHDVTVLGCAYVYGTARPEDSSFKANGAGAGPNAGINPLRIVLRSPETGEPTLPPQQGTSRAARQDVFGGWRVISHEGGYFATGPWGPGSAETAECVSRADGRPESRDFKPWEGYPASDFPTLPATPGWPDVPTS